MAFVVCGAPAPFAAHPVFASLNWCQATDGVVFTPLGVVSALLGRSPEAIQCALRGGADVVDRASLRTASVAQLPWKLAVRSQRRALIAAPALALYITRLRKPVARADVAAAVESIRAGGRAPDVTHQGLSVAVRDKVRDEVREQVHQASSLPFITTSGGDTVTLTVPDEESGGGGGASKRHFTLTVDEFINTLLTPWAAKVGRTLAVAQEAPVFHPIVKRKRVA